VERGEKKRRKEFELIKERREHVERKAKGEKVLRKGSEGLQ
jgi:hypothetical protein